MSRSIDNVTKTKKLTPGGGNNVRHNRKSYHKLSDSSSISSNRNSHSEDDIRVEKNDSGDEQEQITKKLQAQVKELRHKLRILEDSIDSKDYSLGTISREKDRAIGEIRRLERSNKLLRQQLNDERNHYWEEKEKFCEEMTKYKKKLQDVKSDTDKRRITSGRQPLINQSFVRQLSKQRGDFVEEKSGREVKKSKSHNLELKNRKSNSASYFSFTEFQRKQSSLESIPFYGGDDVLLQIAALRTENARLRSIIGERDEQNYELCLRFLRMKHSKNDIRDKFQDLENEYLQVIANLMDKIDEARQEFNFIIDQKFKRPLHSTNAMYLQMVQKNSRIAFENAALRLENQCLKKELNKYINSSYEYDSVIKRRNVSEPANDELEAKVSAESSKNSEKLKAIKKNVNFKEVRTIFERCQTYRNSDTDSNYMSKTPTTGASNGSLRDPKSAESIPEEVGEEKKVPLSSQSNPFSDEILKKIFQRIDSSCQSLDASKTKEPPQNDSKPKDSEVTEQTPDSTQKEVAVINTPKLMNSPSPSEKKKSEKPKKDNYFWLGRCSWKDEQPLLKTQLKNHVRCEWKFDKSPEGLSLDFPLRKFTLTRSSRSAKPSKALREEPKPPNPIQTPKPTAMVQTLDSCGLQEKLDFSDLELPGDGNQSLEPENPVGEKPEHSIVRVELVESEEEDLVGNERMKTLTPAVGSRSKSSNKVNLQAELMEANLRQISPHEPWRNENKVQTAQWNSSTKTNGSEKESVTINLQRDLSSIHEMVPRGIESPPQQRKPETCKRFSHRLFTTSPEELKNILTDSQLGSIKMSPAIVGHAITEVIPAFKPDPNEILMQLILPPSNSENSAVYSQTDLTESLTAEKEASLTVISPAEPIKSTNQMEMCGSDVRIPLSSLPTSNSTMEMIETGALERGKLVRTLSAPGLMESSWLDPHTLCEMRDCNVLEHLGHADTTTSQAHLSTSDKS